MLWDMTIAQNLVNPHNNAEDSVRDHSYHAQLTRSVAYVFVFRRLPHRKGDPMPYSTFNVAVANEIGRRRPAPVDCEVSVLEASRLMRSSGSDELLVTDRAEGTLVPLGIVTARDIVTRIVAAELDPAVVTAGDITWPGSPGGGSADTAPPSLHLIPEDNSDVLALVHTDGRLAGIVTIEELMTVLMRKPAGS
jgi:CBS domain-containing protein